MGYGKHTNPYPRPTHAEQVEAHNAALRKLDRPKFDASILIEDSNWIDSIQYDAETFVLDAMLTSGKRYRYRDVSPMVFARVVTAKSSGKAFNEYLKPLKHKTLPRRK